jgi:uncharacterized protein YlxW (UPF0749 family)
MWRIVFLKKNEVVVDITKDITTTLSQYMILEQKYLKLKNHYDKLEAKNSKLQAKIDKLRHKKKWWKK